MPRRKKAEQSEIVKILSRSYVMWDIHEAIEKAVDEFEAEFGSKPDAVVLPVEIKGVPILVGETAKNGVYVGPVPTRKAK
jgi:hypothetical protein